MEKIFYYMVEKVLSPIKAWFTVLFVSGIFVFLSKNLKTYFGILNFSETYKGILFFIFVLSAIVFTIKLIDFFVPVFKEMLAVDTSNFNDKERAILRFFISIQYQDARLKKNYTSVVSLMNRKFLEISPSYMLVIGGSIDEFDRFELTKAGKKKLLSKKFQRELFNDEFDDNNILTFINSISDRQYYKHNQQNIR